jgi:hypothetical protein
MLCSAEIRSRLCEAETVKRAKRASKARASARTGLRTVCEPATVADVCEHIAVLIPEHSAGRPADSYSAALTMDVGTLEPRRAGSGLPPAAHRRDTEAMRGSCHTLLL